jgi:hypothetical protein
MRRVLFGFIPALPFVRALMAFICRVKLGILIAPDPRFLTLSPCLPLSFSHSLRVHTLIFALARAHTRR